MARTMTALIAGAGATALVLSACGGGSGSGTANGSGTFQIGSAAGANDYTGDTMIKIG